MPLALWIFLVLNLVLRPDPTLPPAPNGEWVVRTERSPGEPVLLLWNGHYWASRWFCKPAPRGGVACEQVVIFPDEDTWRVLEPDGSDPQSEMPH